MNALAVVQTGEALPMSKAEAEALTSRIVASAGEMADRMVTLTDLMSQAHTGKVWAAMGYPNFNEWAEAEVWGDGTLRLRRGALESAVRALSSKGMSTREIAAATGANQSTVVRAQGRVRADAFASPQGGEEPVEAPARVRPVRQRPWRDRWFRAHYDAAKKVAALERVVKDSSPRHLRADSGDRYRREAADLARRLAAVVEALGGEPTP